MGLVPIVKSRVCPTKNSTTGLASGGVGARAIDRSHWPPAEVSKQRGSPRARSAHPTTPWEPHVIRLSVNPMICSMIKHRWIFSHSQELFTWLTNSVSWRAATGSFGSLIQGYNTLSLCSWIRKHRFLRNAFHCYILHTQDSREYKLYSKSLTAFRVYFILLCLSHEPICWDTYRYMYNKRGKEREVLFIF